MTELDADVIVAGAGPSGLMVAHEAARAGARVIVVERRGEPALSRAGSLQPRVLEIFDARGLIDRFMHRAHELHAQPKSHNNVWAGFPGVRYELLDTEFPYVMWFTQIETERLLAQEAARAGASIRRGIEVVSVSQDPDSVTIGVREGADGAVRSISSTYLVGADGARSTVRREIGVAFEGHDADRTAINVDAEIDFPWDTSPRLVNNANGWGLAYPLRDRFTRFGMIDAVTSYGDPRAPVTIEEGTQSLRNIFGSDFGITEALTSRFHNELKVADRMREGRVFLVGESVRVHYPASGVGLNFCLQDAFNLGWKLAAAVDGTAPEWLLDSYEAERRPEVDKLVDDVRRQTAIQFSFTEEMLALKRMIEKELIPIEPVNRMLGENLSGLSAWYRPDGADHHPLVGRRLGDVKLVRGDGSITRVHELLRDMKFVLLDMTGAGLRPLPRGWGERVSFFSGSQAVPRPELDGVETILLRPDGHVAWIGPLTAIEEKREGLVRWLGEA